MIEKILKEINRLKGNLDGYSASEALDYIEAYINTLPEEHASESLEEEINKYITGKNPAFENDPIPRNLFNDCIIAAARHFANWQKAQDRETIELAEDHAMFAGMEKMREEMMKDAVEAEVFTDYNINFGYGSLTANIDLDEQHLKEGDKVKIIIVKTEQQ